MSQDIALRVVGNDRDSIDGSIEGVGRKNDLNNKLSNLQNILTIIVVVVLIQAIGLIALIVKTNKDESVSLNQSILLSENKAVSDYDILGELYEGMGHWTERNRMPVALSDHAIVSCRGLFYILGGLNASDDVQDSIHVFDPIFEIYEKLDIQMPTPRFRFCATCIKDDIFFFGGFATKEDGDSGTPLNTVDIFRTHTKHWDQGANMSHARGDIACSVLNDKAYVFGGFGEEYDMSISGTSSESYDPENDEWNQLTNMPTSRGDAAAVTLNSRIYVLGGWSDKTENFVATVESFDPKTNSWGIHEDIPMARGDSAVVIWNNKILSIGGEIWSGTTYPCYFDPSIDCNRNEIPIHSVLQYDPSHKIWTKLAPIPVARFRLQAAVNDGTVFVFGGHRVGNFASDKVEAFYHFDHPTLFLHRLSELKEHGEPPSDQVGTDSE